MTAQLRMCTEVPLSRDLHVMKTLREKSISKAHFERLKAAFYTQKMWQKDSVITYSFVSSPDMVNWTPIYVMQLHNNLIDPIEEAIRHLSPIDAINKIIKDRIQPMTNLKFKQLDQGGNVRIGFDPYGGCWSLIGKDCISSNEETTMNFGWLDGATIMHEFLHVLGLIHEHQNPEGKGIEWNEPKVYEWAKQTQGWDHETTYHNIIEKYQANQINGSEYDPKSIMLYFFPASLTLNNKGTNQNNVLSITDITYTMKNYPGSAYKPDRFFKLTREELNQSRINILKYIAIILIVTIIAYIFVHLFYSRQRIK